MKNLMLNFKGVLIASFFLSLGFTSCEKEKPVIGGSKDMSSSIGEERKAAKDVSDATSSQLGELKGHMTNALVGLKDAPASPATQYASKEVTSSLLFFPSIPPSPKILLEGQSRYALYKEGKIKEADDRYTQINSMIAEQTRSLATLTETLKNAEAKVAESERKLAEETTKSVDEINRLKDALNKVQVAYETKAITLISAILCLAGVASAAYGFLSPAGFSGRVIIVSSIFGLAGVGGFSMIPFINHPMTPFVFLAVVLLSATVATILVYSELKAQRLKKAKYEEDLTNYRNNYSRLHETAAVVVDAIESAPEEVTKEIRNQIPKTIDRDQIALIAKLKALRPSKGLYKSET